jgi:hypothetical protein
VHRGISNAEVNILRKATRRIQRVVLELGEAYERHSNFGLLLTSVSNRFVQAAWNDGMGHPAAILDTDHRTYQQLSTTMKTDGHHEIGVSSNHLGHKVRVWQISVSKPRTSPEV